MSPQRLQLADDLVLDARRAVWLPREQALVVPDVHLGYAWVQRRRGQLLPVGLPDDTLDRLDELRRDYQPRRLIFLGDLVHAACDLEPLRQDLQALERRFGRDLECVLVLGNHDVRLPALLADCGFAMPSVRWLDMGRFRLVHGHEPAPVDALEPAGRMLIGGHEHPSLELGDGIATRVKCPAFAVAEDTLVVPAFSDWAAGCSLQRGDYLGPVARLARFHSVVACVGPRLLRLPFGRIHAG